ncbi:MAG: BACON domain-containing protein, partial [Planctomycetota bacterium]
MMKKIFRMFGLTLLFWSLTMLWVGPSDAVTNVIRNGSFNNDLDQWVLNPLLTAYYAPYPGWPLQGDAVKANLNPPLTSFTGTVISQTLNVSGIGGRTFVLSMKLTKNYNPPGNTIAVYLTYIDSSAGTQRVLISNPANAAITTDTPVTGIYTFRSTAQTLTKIEFAKIDNRQQFLVDDITLTYDATDAKQIPLPATATGGANLTLTYTGVHPPPPPGFSFATGQVAAAASDFVITGYEGNAPPYSAYGWLQPGVTYQDLGVKAISEVTEVPSTGYPTASTSASLMAGHAYAFQLAGGSYGVLAVKTVTPINPPPAVTMVFDYKYLSGPTISFIGSVKTAPNWPSIDGMAAVAGAAVTAYLPGTTPTPIGTATPDSSTGAFAVTGIPGATDFYLMVQPPAPPPTAYMPVLSKFMNWADNIQALLPFALLTQEQYASFANGTGNGMIMGRVALKDTPTTSITGATITATEFVNGSPTATTYPVTYTSGSATGSDGVYMVKSVPAGKLVKLVATLAGYTFEFNDTVVPVMSGAVSEESFFGTAANCTYAVDTASASIPAAGQATPGTVNVTAGTGCAWTAVSNNSAWLHVSSPGSGTGTGSFSYTVDVNDGAARTGTISIASQIFNITQAGTTATGPVKGDINNDNAVTLADAILALQVTSGMTPTVGTG